MKRGEIWWTDLPVPRRSEPGFRRPVLVIQADDFNESAIRTVVCAVITSNLRLARAPGNLRLGRREARLPAESVVNVSQVMTLDKKALLQRVGALNAARMREVERGLKLVLALQ